MNENILVDYCRKNPFLQVEDLFKFLYQSTHGCEHLVVNEEIAYRRLQEELPRAKDDLLPAIEPLYGDFSRVHLKVIPDVMSAEELFRIFMLSAQKQENAVQNLEGKLKEVKNLCLARKLPFSFTEVQTKSDNWKALGYPALHHSEVFREEYRPCYRVVRNRYLGSCQWTETEQSAGSE